MALTDIRPFRAQRYQSSAGELANLIAPPVSRLNLETRAAYAERSPNNAVNVAYPAGSRDERSKYIKYARCGAFFQDWQRNGIIATDVEPSLYRLEIGLPDGRQQTGIYALVRLDTFSVDAAPDEDFRFLLEATHSWFEPVITVADELPPDAVARINRIEGGSHCSVSDDDGNVFVLDVINDASLVATVQDALKSVQLRVVEGAGRVVAAQAFAARKPDGNEREQWIPVVILDQALTIPRHRIYPASVAALLSELPEGREVHVSRLRALPDQESISIGTAREGGLGEIYDGVTGEQLDQFLGTAATKGVSYSDNVNEVITASNQGALGIVFSGGSPMPDAWLAAPPPVGLIYWNLGDFV